MLRPAILGTARSKGGLYFQTSGYDIDKIVEQLGAELQIESFGQHEPFVYSKIQIPIVFPPRGHVKTDFLTATVGEELTADSSGLEKAHAQQLARNSMQFANRKGKLSANALFLAPPKQPKSRKENQ